MQDDQGYNGWKNYETWSVALIIDNDQRLQAAAREVVDLARMEARQDDEPDYIAVLPPADHERYRAADALRDWVERFAEVDLEISDQEPMSYLWSQLASAAMGRVDWDEVARHYLDA
jgi:hypothetical protein